MRSLEDQKQIQRMPQESSAVFGGHATKRYWFYGFFFVSGFCSLVYEVVWLRLIMAKFGITTPTVSLVLSVFMAGLGLGSWAGGIYMRRFKGLSASAPLRLYGLLELVIGCSSVMVPVIINWGYRLLRDSNAGLAWNSSTYFLFSGGWILFALLPWCACMGATFPFAMAAIRKISTKESKRSFSYLYLANVLGAVLGTLVPAFVLIELFGFAGTLHIAGTANALLAAAVFLLSFNLPSINTSPINEPIAPEWRSDTSTRTALWLLFTTGFCSMAMEVVWIRQFTVYLGNLVYAFAIILALYLLATFIGSSIYRKWIPFHEPSVVGKVWIPLGLLSLLPLLLSDPRLPIPLTVTIASLGFGAIRVVLGIALFSGLVGFITPMLVDQWSGGIPDRAGKAYAVNVLGSIVGPLAAGFVVLPLAGERWGLCLLAIPLFVIGGVSAFRTRLQTASWIIKSRALYSAAVLCSLVLLIATKDFGTKYSPRIELRDHTATVIAAGEGMKRRLLVNGTGMTKLTPITKMMAHLPLAFLQRPPKDALVICFGMGTTFRSMMSWGINVTAVELVPSVPKLFGYFHPDGPELLRSPRARMVIDDGRRFLERSRVQYDVIAIDPPPPISAPTSSLLYSEEFYAIVKRHLRAGGILQVWCPGGDRATMAAITRALFNSFPHVNGYESLEDWGVHYLVSMQPLGDLEAEDLARKMPPAAARDLVEWNPDKTPTQMFDYVLGGEEELQDYITDDPGVPPITDDRPINEYFLLRSAGLAL